MGDVHIYTCTDDKLSEFWDTIAKGRVVAVPTETEIHIARIPGKRIGSPSQVLIAFEHRGETLVLDLTVPMMIAIAKQLHAADATTSVKLKAGIH